MTAQARWRRLRRVAVTTVGGLAGLVVLLTVGLAVWDGGADLDPRRVLLPGVRLDLRTIETRHGPIEYDLHGTAGAVVLSMHAGLGGADQGRLFASWLQDDGFRILSPSRPGYLGTPLSSGRTLEQQADLVAALLDELGVERVGVFAVSAGGPAAYTFAARHPERVWGLVVVGGESLPDPGTGQRSALRSAFVNKIGQKLARLTAWVSLDSIVAATVDETSSFTAGQKAERVDHIVHDDSARTLFSAMFDTTFPYEKRMPGTRNDASQKREMRLPFDRITAPALILHGTQDGDVPLADGENAAAHIRGARHHWMPDEDHLGFWLSPRSSSAQLVARSFLHDHVPSR
jgi:pimeloyl-ACP methyl ester carboxylesterase